MRRKQAETDPDPETPSGSDLGVPDIRIPKASDIKCKQNCCEVYKMCTFCDNKFSHMEYSLLAPYIPNSHTTTPSVCLTRVQSD